MQVGATLGFDSLGDAAVSLGALAVVGAGIALGELALRRAARVTPRTFVGRRTSGLTARQAQALYERVLYVFAPALVAGALTARQHERLSLGLLVTACVLLVRLGLWPSRSVLHLMPVSRVVLLFVVPAAGMALAVAPGLFDDWPLTPESAAVPLLGAWFTTLLGIWLHRGFTSERPVRLAVIGDREYARKLAVEMRQSDLRGYVMVGFVAPESEPTPDAAPIEVVPWLGSLDEIRSIATSFSIDLIAVGPGNPRLQVFETAAASCLDLPVRMIEASALYEDVLGHVPIGTINSAWFQAIMHPRYSPSSPLSKRVLDLMVAIPAALLVALPLLPLLALAIKLGDRGPVFFRQRRVGEQGREFDIIKLRTMRTDAAELVDQVPKDELITPVGKILRKTHLDELPQVFNVLKGDMTLVGPRPEQPLLVERLTELVPYYQRRSLVKPGVTGWAQVRCGYAGTRVGTAWKMCHDLFYVKHRSLAFDLLIMIQTLHIFSEGADRELAAPDHQFILGESEVEPELSAIR